MGAAEPHGPGVDRVEQLDHVVVDMVEPRRAALHDVVEADRAAIEGVRVLQRVGDGHLHAVVEPPEDARTPGGGGGGMGVVPRAGGRGEDEQALHREASRSTRSRW